LLGGSLPGLASLSEIPFRTKVVAGTLLRGNDEVMRKNSTPSSTKRRRPSSAETLEAG
jgi:hypothetical protein